MRELDEIARKHGLNTMDANCAKALAQLWLLDLDRYTHALGRKGVSIANLAGVQVAAAEMAAEATAREMK